ncbi:MAG TPA: NAD(P)/FAD-dependent oxidoreductase [Alphaproteobacteria bacterium]|jgi:L-2-hydroxyglutarate oxidase LhgO|nr:NAD(P)/FAD-dependent oxidoreductase [Alphaproteobacteria bacterium]HJM50458.1 NAD(P)/FAD-dependent oxidoreductase [Alphaproteobacteria bacterium]
MVEAVECVVVGAGVVGLALARALARRGREVLVLEAAAGIGSATSSRNSEVIHAGIYYPRDSLKARLCVAGRQALYHFCRDRGVPHKRLGKLIVAGHEDEFQGLERLRQSALGNGVDDLVFLPADEARALEPELACAGALLSPSTGIIDAHALMLALQAEAEAGGAVIALKSPLRGGQAGGQGFRLRVGLADGSDYALDCRLLVNSAGLQAQEVAAGLAGLPATSIPRRHLNRGCYFALRGASPFRHLIYPLPGSASLGVHLTIDLAGQARFGPDQEWIDSIDYEVDPARAEGFYAAIRGYYPALAEGALSPAYAGIRPKLQAPGEAVADFIIQGPAEHGLAGLVNLYGIESPGLTAALAIADHAAELVGTGV